MCQKAVYSASLFKFKSFRWFEETLDVKGPIGQNGWVVIVVYSLRVKHVWACARGVCGPSIWHKCKVIHIYAYNLNAKSLLSINKQIPTHETTTHNRSHHSYCHKSKDLPCDRLVAGGPITEGYVGVRNLPELRRYFLADCVTTVNSICCIDLVNWQ